MDVTKIVQSIQYVLAPAVMVSSAALLLLGYQNKFSNLASRFRALNHERRLLSQKISRDPLEETRLQNLIEQIDQLMQRANHVKNAIVLAYFSIISFTGASFLIFLNVYAFFRIYHVIFVIFFLGLLALLNSAILMTRESWLSYRIIALESRS